MSIIHDALKKTQNNLKKTRHDNTSKDTEQNIPVPNILQKPDKPDEPTGIHISYSAILLFCLILSTIILSINMIIYFIKSKATPASKTQANKSSLSPRTSRSNIVPDAQHHEQSLVLNGTLMADDKKAALINNELYELGESIGEKTINKISINEVELIDKNGNITVLKVKK